MSQLLSQLQSQLAHVLHLVEDPFLLALTAQEGETFLEQAITLSHRLERAESEPLTIGLLGGTGVGKSTILNALADSDISTSSHRRPWTDHVLIYRHEEAKGLPPERLNHIPWQEFTHRNASIGKILLCDLPDFDSIQTEHRERVLGFLEHLDLLIWVSSPEKYADQKFHGFLAAVPKAQQNFFFVLNKVDLVFDGSGPEKGYEEVAAMSQAFQKRLRESGVSDPLVFFISAKDGRNGQTTAPWNQFPSFKKQVFQERRFKEAMTIKASNLDVEVRSLLRHVGQGIKSLEAFQSILSETMDQLRSQRNTWLEEWERALEGWTESHVRAKMGGQRPEPLPLLWPGYSVALLMDRLSWGINRTGEPPPELSVLDAVCSTLKNQLQWLEARIDRQLLHYSLPEVLTARAKSMLQISERVKSLQGATLQTLAWHLAKAPWPSFLGFKLWQGACYFLVLAIFAMAIGGESSWEGFVNAPGLKSLFQLILSSIHTLFSTKGFAALGSYLILNVFLGFRFYRRFSKLVQRVVEKRVEALRAGLTSIWENELDALLGSLSEVQEEINQEKSKISHVIGSS